MSVRRPVLLAILDGWGIGEENDTNAIHVARTPNMDRWQREYPYTTLKAHGEAVGLPEGQMGNSEVGHLNIGAGRIVWQDFTRINFALESGEFFANETLKQAMDAVRENGSALHLMGLVSDGGVHSHIRHLFGLVKMAADQGLDKIYIHAFMDGRDTPPRSGKEYIRQLQAELDRLQAGRIATITGRYYAMDRDNRWDRVKKAWLALVEGEGVPVTDPVQAVSEAYSRDETDEFIKPMVLMDGDQPRGRIQDRDTIIFFNFRADRARQLTQAFTAKEFTGFDCPHRPQPAEYVTFTEYDRNFDLPVAFPPQTMKHILGEEICRHGLHQLRIAETEKYAHVTFFFNGGREKPYGNEDRALIASPQEVATYDEKPEMSAFEVTDELLRRMDNGYDLVILNFANGDMVGHSGRLEAAVKACEAVDQCMGRLAGKFLDLGGTVLITADHGNAEKMKDLQTEDPFTAHTSSDVPFIVINDALKGRHMKKGGSLRDIAPTVLNLFDLPVPEDMEGECLIC